MNKVNRKAFEIAILNGLQEHEQAEQKVSPHLT